MKRFWAVGLAALMAAPACGDGEGGSGGGTGTTTSSSTVGAGGSDCPSPFAECDGDPGTVCETRVDTNAQHCGACDHACPAAAHQIPLCQASACAVECEAGYQDCDGDPTNGCEEQTTYCGVTTLVDGVPYPMGLAVDDAYIYYGSKGTPPDYADSVIYRVAKTGGAPSVLAQNQNNAVNLSIDDTTVFVADGGHVDQPDGSIVAIPKTGGSAFAITSGAIRPNNPLPVGAQLFWTTHDLPHNRIMSAEKDGSSPMILAEMIAGIPTGLRLAGTSILVWTAPGTIGDGSDATVSAMDITGGSVSVLATGIAQPSYKPGVTADAVYVGSRADGSLYRVPFDATGKSVVATNLVDPQEILADGDRLYITTGAGHQVIAMPVTGGTPTIIADNQLLPSYLAMDADYVYWVDGYTLPTGAVRRAKKPAP